jgi:hypothetical protein
MLSKFCKAQFTTNWQKIQVSEDLSGEWWQWLNVYSLVTITASES